MENPASTSCAENIALFHLLHASRGRDSLRALSSDSVPERPSKDPMEPLPIHREDYVLSFERERSLAGALAYISNIKGDINRVPAICITEDHRPQREPSLQILLAVNTTEYKDGDQVLDEIKAGFESIFAALSRIGDECDDQAAVEHEIHHVIVSMCSDRILHRLNLKKRKNRKLNQPAKEKFQNLIRALKPHGVLPRLTNISDEDRSLFLERAKTIIHLIDAWKGHPRAEKLEDLVFGFYRLRKLDCEAVVNAIPDYEMDINAKASLMNMILKVARYAEAARFLFRTAKKFSIARRLKVIPVSLEEIAFTRTPTGPEYKLNVSSMLSRICGPDATEVSGPGYYSDDVYRLLDTSPDEAGADLTAQVRETLGTGKVHAEVQLVFYCEMLKIFKGPNKEVLPPRIVCSSKKACFLCNLLVSMHGMMRTPWSHGKLYPGWRLPQCAGKDLQVQFNRLLEDRIKESVRLLIQRRGKTTYPGPSESTLITLPSLGSRTESFVSPKHDIKAQAIDIPANGVEEASEDVTSQATGDTEDPKSSSGSCSSKVDVGPVPSPVQSSGAAHEHRISDFEPRHAPSKLSHETESMTEGSNPQAQCGAKTPSSHEQPERLTHSATSSATDAEDSSEDHGGKYKDVHTSPDDPRRSLDLEEPLFRSSEIYKGGAKPLEEYHHLREGEELTETVLPEHIKTFFTRKLLVQVEYSTGSSMKAEACKQPLKLPFSIQRLRVDEAARLKDDGNMSVGEVKGIIGDVPLVFPSMGSLHIPVRGDVFRIAFH